MNSLKLKTKHAKSHGWIAMLVCWFFGVRTTENRKINWIKKELKVLNGLKTKNALHNHPFLCLYPQNNQFKKKT
jgi:hypothetical protein